MANVESAVKQFIYDTGCTLSLEVTAETVADTRVAKRIRYRVHEKKSGMLFTEYFDALTDVASDYGDLLAVHSRLMATYSDSITLRKEGEA